MSNTFSMRMGIIKPRDIYQLENMDIKLRTRLYNCYLERGPGSNMFEASYSYSWSQETPTFIAKCIWDEFFKQRLDILNRKNLEEAIFSLFFKEDYNKIYDFFEYIFTFEESYPRYKHWHNNDVLKFLCNKILTEEFAGYLVIGNTFVQITNQVEQDTIEEGLNSPCITAQRHFGKAFNLLTDRNNPDFTNSIKESISGVEAACREILGNEKAILSKALSKLKERNGYHSQLLTAFENLYSFSSDSQGIRHSSKKSEIENNENYVDFHLAKYMLVSCMAFVHYLLSTTNRY